MKKKLLPVVLLMFSSLASFAQVQIGTDIDGEAANDWSGRSVSMPDAYTMAVGAYQNSGNGYQSGHVRVLTWNGSAWIQKGQDIDGDPGDRASVVSMPNGNTVAIGAPNNDGNGTNSGRVRVYTWNGSAWVQKGLDIFGESANDYSGTVSMPDENTLAIGAEYNDGGGLDAGHVRIFSWNGSAWVQKGLDLNGEAAGDRSGQSVSMPDINTVAIGALQNDGNGSNSGHTRIFRWNGTAWIQKGVDINGEAAGDNSGTVSMPNPNTVAIGAVNNNWDINSSNNGWGQGHVRIYDWNGSSWTQRGLDIDGESPFDWSGHSVSMPDANTVAIGAPRSTSFAGQVRVFSWNGSAWVQKGVDMDGEAMGDYSGSAVSMPNPNMVAIGASGNNGNGSSAGHTRVFSLCESKAQTDFQVVCGAFTWINGVTYTESIKGPTVTQFDANGCRYDLILNLYILSAGTSTLEWARSTGNSNGGAAKTVVSGTDGSVYVAGSFSGTVDFDPGSASYPLTASGIRDLFVQKLDTDGNFVWAKNIGGAGANVIIHEGATIALDNQGKVYVGGYFDKTVDFDPNAGVTQLSGTLSGMDAFILKLTSSGNLEWVKKFGGNGVDQVNSISIDADNNVCATGNFRGSVDFDPGAGTSYLFSDVNITSAFVSKLKENGDFVWAKQLSGDGSLNTFSIATSLANDIYITGKFYGTADFNPGTGVSSLTASTGSEADAYLLKLNVNGNFQWVRQIRGSSDVSGNAVAVNPDGEVYVTGQFAQTADFNFPLGTISLLSAGSRDIFIAKYNGIGEGVWLRQFGGDGVDIPFAMTSDMEGNVYTTGYFSQKVDFSSGDPTGVLTANSNDVFVLMLDKDGGYTWVHQLGGSGIDIGFGVHTNANGSVHVAGQFETTASFSSGLSGPGVSSNGLTDAFVFKMNVCGTSTGPQPISPRAPITDVSELNSENRDVVLYPNPTMDGIFQIVSEDKMLDVKIFDITGRLMPVEYDLINNTVKGTDLSAGEYIIHIRTENGFYTKKMVKSMN